MTKEFIPLKGRQLALVEHLEAEIERLRAALKPFAEFAEMVANEHPGWDHDQFRVTDDLMMAPFRQARSVLGRDVQQARSADTRRWADGYCADCGERPGKCSCVQSAPEHVCQCGSSLLSSYCPNCGGRIGADPKDAQSPRKSFVDKHGFEICATCRVEIKGGRCACDDPFPPCADPKSPRTKVVGRVTGQIHEGDQVPGMPGAICHACGLAQDCGNPDCPNAAVVVQRPEEVETCEHRPVGLCPECYVQSQDKS